MISQTHSNLNAAEFKSSFCVLPIWLHGEMRVKDEDTVGAIVDLLRLAKSHNELQHYGRRTNTVPGFIDDDVGAKLDCLIDLMVAKYEVSIGTTRHQTGGQSRADEGEAPGTSKAHQLFFHMRQDIKGCGI